MKHYINQVKRVSWIDLLNYESEDKYSRNPDLLYLETKEGCYSWVVIDEIQKTPKLLDIIHKSIEDKNIDTKFALTGSSARKLKRGASNLLAGHAFEHFLITQIYFINELKKSDFRFSFLKTADGVEIDLIVERPGMPLAIIEIKSYTMYEQQDVNKLATFKKDFGEVEAYLFYRGEAKVKISEVDILPWQDGIKILFQN